MLGLFDSIGGSSKHSIKFKPLQYKKCHKCENWMDSYIRIYVGYEYNICEYCGVLIKEGEGLIKDIDNVKYISRWFWRKIP